MKKNTLIQSTVVALFLAAPFMVQARSSQPQSLQEQLNVLKAQNAKLRQTVQKFEAI